MPWSQVYDPLHSAWLSTLLAALPVVVIAAGILVSYEVAVTSRFEAGVSASPMVNGIAAVTVSTAWMAS